MNTKTRFAFFTLFSSHFGHSFAFLRFFLLIFGFFRSRLKNSPITYHGRGVLSLCAAADSFLLPLPAKRSGEGWGEGYKPNTKGIFV